MKNLIYILVIGALIVLGYTALNNKDTKNTNEPPVVENQDVVSDSVSTDINIESEIVAGGQEADEAISPGTYEDYAPEKLAKADNGNVVLFFRASWCPTCRALDKDINANLSNIPSDLTILNVNYDKSSDLKKKYGVTVQHTLVQVSSDGTLIQKWSGGSTLETIVSKI